MKKINNSNGFGAVEILLILVVVILISFIGFWVYSQNKTSSDKSSPTTSTSPQKTENKTVTEANETVQPAAERKLLTPTVEEKSAIQAAALKYIERTKPFDNKKEVTYVSENRNYAIQYYCGGHECSVVALQKTRAGWEGIYTGIDVQTAPISQLAKDHGWPTNFY